LAIAGLATAVLGFVARVVVFVATAVDLDRTGFFAVVVGMTAEFMVIATLRVGDAEQVDEVEIEDGPAGILRMAHQFWPTVSSVSKWGVAMRESESGRVVNWDSDDAEIGSDYIFRQTAIYHYVRLRTMVAEAEKGSETE
jgi:hypothetical protein